MTSIQRIRAVWTGFPGGPGLSTFYFGDAPAAQGALQAFIVGLAGLLPNDVTIRQEPGGDVIDDATGALVGSWAGTLQDSVTGLYVSQPYSSLSGALVRWETATIRSGSRMRGRTYVVPIAVAGYSAAGGLAASTQSGLSAVASDFVGAVTPNLLVWQRPRAAKAAWTGPDGRVHKAVSQRPGSSSVVISSSVPTEAVVLRSRRD